MIEFRNSDGAAEIWVNGSLCMELNKDEHDLATADEVIMAVAEVLKLDYTYRCL